MFGFLKKQFIDVIEWTESEAGVLSYRYPMQDREIQNGAKLTVRESQIAVFVNEGRIADVKNPGLHTLNTQTLPVLTNLMNWDKLFQSPFKSDVYFFSTREQIGLKWGTQNPITVNDPQFGPIRLRAFGSYSFRITDPVTFHKKLSGSTEVYRVAECESQLRGGIGPWLATFLGQSKMPFLEMAANQMNFSNMLKENLQSYFQEYGLQISQFFVESLSLPEEVQAYLDKKSSMAVLGDLQKYTQFQTAEAITAAAKNEGGLAGLGANVGVGAAIGQAMAQSMNSGSLGGASGGDDVFKTIEKLHQLKEKGIISAQEFEAKKAELMKKI